MEQFSLETFVDKLIEEKKLGSLDEKVIAQMKEDLMSRLESKIQMTIIENMPPQYLEEFEQLLDSQKNDEEVQAYCAEKIPNLKELVAASLLEFRKTYING